MDQPNSLSGGELNAAITREVIRIQNAKLGRGPKRAYSFYQGNVVVTVMQEVMAQAERSLADDGDGDAVLEMRRLYQRAMEAELKERVEALTDRKVTAFMADNHLEPDMAVKVFVLDEPLG